MSITFAEQEQPSSSPKLRCLGIRAGKILRQKNVFMTVPIKVSHPNPENWRKLRLHRERYSLESSTPVEKQTGIQCFSREHLESSQGFTENLLHRQGAEF